MLKSPKIILLAVIGGIIGYSSILFLLNRFSYVLVINNKSPLIIENIIIEGGGCYEEISSLAPRSSVKLRLWFEQDGELLYTSKQHSSAVTIEGYVTHSLGDRAEVLIHEDGALSVYQLSP